MEDYTMFQILSQTQVMAYELAKERYSEFELIYLSLFTKWDHGLPSEVSYYYFFKVKFITAQQIFP